MKDAELPLVLAHAAPLVLRHDGATEPLTFPVSEKDNRSDYTQTSLMALQVAVGGFIEAVAVPWAMLCFFPRRCLTRAGCV